MKRSVILAGAMMMFMLSACGVTTTTVSAVSLPNPPAVYYPPAGNNPADICDIERIYTDALFCGIMEGEEIPTVVLYGIGGEGGYAAAYSEDPDTIRGFIDGLRDIKIKSTAQDPDGKGYVADGGEDIVFGMANGTQFSLALDGRIRIHNNGVVFEIENTQKLSQMCVLMQEMAYINQAGGIPGDGYIAVIHGGVGEQTYETYVYEEDNAYKYINVESTTVSWGSTQWNHEVLNIGMADTKEEVIEKAAQYGAAGYVSFPGDNTPHSFSDF